MFLMPKGSKKIVKKAQNDLTRTHRSKYRGLGRANDEAKKQNEEHPGQPPPQAARGGGGTAVLPPLPPIRVFLMPVFSFQRFCATKACSFSAMAIQFHYSSTIFYLPFIELLREGWREQKKICERDGGLSEDRKIQAKLPN